MKIKLDNFTLEEYSKNNNEHNYVINELNKDEASKKYLGDLFYTIEKVNIRKEEDKINNNFIAYYNDYPVGYLNITKKNDEYNISYGILNKFRGEHLASLLIEEYSDYLLDKYKEIDKLMAIIDKENIGSKKTATLASFVEEGNIKFSRGR